MDETGVDVKYDQEYVNKIKEKIFIFDFFFFSFFPPTKILFSEHRVRFPPESVDLKKLSPGDPCEVFTINS
jgi:hypothetical protein